MNNSLFRQIDNSALILFRMLFGFLFACEAFGAVLTGWVKHNFLLPEFTFSFIGFEWLQPLPGYGMYGYYFAMGMLSIAVMLGYRYRWSVGLLTLLWSGTYFMQKTSYNNHYYLLMLVGLILFFLPANRYASLDVKQKRVVEQLSMPSWCAFVMIFQMAIVYFFATLAKFYPDWLDGTYTRILFFNIAENSWINVVFRQHWFSLFIAYAGIAFDGLIVPMLLWKRTRTLAVVAALFFHLFNSVFLKIGIFPYFALSFALFFYPPETIRALFFKNKPVFNTENALLLNQGRKIVYLFFIPYFILQFLLPLRHWFIKGDVLWTEEGHRLSWRMMLRERSGTLHFRILDKKNKTLISDSFEEHLTHIQWSEMATKPDMIWQTAQRIKEYYFSKGIEVAVFADCSVSVNRKPSKQLIDPNVDLASVKWDWFSHSSWVLLYR
ncbi:HTTM domain-containing protein [Flavobacterium sp. SM15]|uniref:HTTM domain-containing protein n=1 Tax=Flavobacterium sp. SM15 TaxID=2908005 RepID=UPI001EDC7201|nr:HTTM domain-containing protein [Flavobacterium sp. SM15]MCG2612167.1 HTTM domain-containing protein [Flavobacterium sp. SM15]